MSPTQHLWWSAAAATAGITLGVFFDGWLDVLAMLLMLPAPAVLVLPLLRREKER